MKNKNLLEVKILKNIQNYIKKYNDKKIPFQKFRGLVLAESIKSNINNFHKFLLISKDDKDIKKIFEAYKKEIKETLVDNNQISYLNNSGESLFLEDALDNDDEFDIGNFSDSNLDNYGDSGLEDTSNYIQLDENLVNDDYLTNVGSNSFIRQESHDMETTLDNDYILPDFQDNYAIENPLEESNKKQIKEADENIGEDVEYVDKPTLFADLVSIENNLSDAFNSLYPYKFQYIDDPRIKKSLRELRINISDTLTKVTSLISMVGLEKDILSK